MKYPIEDIKTWGEIIIDYDQTFDELIEFYLPFRLSELDTEMPIAYKNELYDLGDRFRRTTS